MSNNYMANQAQYEADMETVPGDFDADDMIVMDGVTVDQTDNEGTIDNHYMMAEPGCETTHPEIEMISGGQEVNHHVDEIDDETTSQFQQRVNG